jgi:peptidyl-prolyl cis-trans isomerase C
VIIKHAFAAVALVAFAGLPIAQAQDTKPAAPSAAAPAKGPAPAKGAAPAAGAPAAATPAATGKDLYPKTYYDVMLKERLSQGQADTPQLRGALHEELNTRELLAREAKKKGLDKNTDIKTQMDLASQTVLVRAFVAEWVKDNPVPEAVLRKEYDDIKAQIGDKEYKVRHILVDNESEAKDIIAALQKGEKFDKLAERSKDPGSKDKGGDLDWNAPGNFVKPFSDAMVATPKGKFTTQPVKTQFGWHVIMVDDIRDAKVPSFDEVKPQLQQRAQAQMLDQYFKELRAKNGV